MSGRRRGRPYGRRSAPNLEPRGVKRWHEEIAARPAVVRGVEVLASARVPLMDDKAKEILFGATQYAKH